MTFGERIAHRRQELGLSQAELAALVERSESWVSQVERGVREVDRLSVRMRLAAALRWRPEDLFPSVQINALGMERVNVFVELLLEGDELDVVLAQLSPDPVVREVVRELLIRVSR